MVSTPEGKRRVDRRVLRTRKAIMSAFEKLISDSDVDRITVSAIAREANIDRKTFYLHYRSVDELANFKTEEALERVLEIITTKGAGKSHFERLHLVLAHVNNTFTSNIPLYAGIARRLSTDKVIEQIARAAENALAHAGYNPELVRNEQLYQKMEFYVAGAVFLYADWLRSDRKQPIETVSEAIEDAITTVYQKGKR